MTREGRGSPAPGAFPTVSIIVPCRNAERHLGQALASALEQTRPPDEIIVVDDGSTDGSVALAQRFEFATGGRVQVLAQPPAGAPRARNRGALAAAGTALMFLDADDVLGPDALAALIACLERAPAGIATCPWYRLQCENGRWVKRPPSCRPRHLGEDALAAWLRGWYHPPCSVLWSRTAFEHAGRWDEEAFVDQDGDLMMRALAAGIPLLHSPAGAAYYRRPLAGGTSLSGKRRSREGLTSRIRTVRKIAIALQERSSLAPYRASLADAFGRIIADAGPDDADLAAQARRLAAEYGPSRPARARSAALQELRRIRRTLPGIVRFSPASHPPTDARHVERTEVEVVCGMTLARDVAEKAGTTHPTPAPPAVQAPRVTVIVPTYNRAHLISRAIDSVLAQTFGDFELLVVDDGSRDATPDLMTAYRDPRVRYLRQPANAGVSAARNRGLRECRGELVAFLDSDDEWFPEKLARQVARFGELPPQVGLLYCGVENVDVHGNRSIRTPAHRGSLYRELLMRNVIHGTSGVMIRRSVVAAVGFFDEGIPAIEDYDYWLRVARFFEIDYLSEPLIRYYNTDTEERKSVNLQENLDARAWIYRRYGDDMRRARVAHLFLLASARRALAAPQPRVATARLLAARAVLEAPVSRYALTKFAQTMLGRAGASSTRA